MTPTPQSAVALIVLAITAFDFFSPAIYTLRHWEKVGPNVRAFPVAAWGYAFAMVAFTAIACFLLRGLCS